MLIIFSPIFVGVIKIKIDFFLNYFLIFPATEIRCQEKSKGGLCYEVILAQPAVAVSPPKPSSAPAIKSVSAEDIEKKLRDAEIRRLVSRLQFWFFFSVARLSVFIILFVF